MGVTKETIREGDGENFPKKGNKLQMHYKGTLASNGTQFDSSYDRGTPFSFKIGKGEVIQGWDEGVIQMSLGEKAKLNISSDFGYGAEGAGGVIPPNADLVFVVELLAIGDKQANIPKEGGCCVIL
ncbi:FK506-binding protein 2 [Seminavis robusta]|uniref:peptidylprolyl isomerase n=1 Tax=Seminavis robusta TaxID=568900 RepID=A0A9N8DZ31_9STRA|nr:FK506-binding protein 2 [Seminavis robusta]|eukprot:Sro483_g152170.1 FK506-binding protein 2 (126) ;mRNA; r:62498-63291